MILFLLLVGDIDGSGTPPVGHKYKNRAVGFFVGLGG